MVVNMSNIIKGAETIAQYKILQWINENFCEGSVAVEFIDNSQAILTDGNGESLTLMYSHGKVEVASLEY